MSLWAKVERTEEPTLCHHDFASIFALWAVGEYDNAGAQAALEHHLSQDGAYSLTAAEQTEATNLLALYTAAPPQKKLEWVVRLEFVGAELSEGRITTAQAQGMLTL